MTSGCQYVRQYFCAYIKPVELDYDTHYTNIFKKKRFLRSLMVNNSLFAIAKRDIVKQHNDLKTFPWQEHK